MTSKTTEHPGLAHRAYAAVQFPPPAEGPLFYSRAHGTIYLGAWGLTATHLILWILIAVGLLTSEAVIIGVSVLSFVATCLLIVVVIAAHRRLELQHGRTSRHLITVWWRGPWDPVGRLVWLPVRLPAAWQAFRHGPGAPPGPGSAADGHDH